MKKMIICALVCLLSWQGYAQSYDLSRLAFTTCMENSLQSNSLVSKQLTNIMSEIAANNGCALAEDQRFVIYASVDEYSSEMVNGLKASFVYELKVNFTLGDGVDGIKYSHVSRIVKGVGETKTDAYRNAFRRIKTEDAEFTQFINKGKERIVEYYRTRCNQTIAQARAFAAAQDYDQAIYLLLNVPDVCEECHLRCMEAVEPIYQTKINQEGARLLAAARAVWASGQNYEKAEEAALFLAEIDPMSSSYAGAQSLSNEMAGRLRQIDEREWNFKLQKQKDATDIEFQRQEVEIARQQTLTDIYFSIAENMPDVIYNLSLW